MFTSRRQRPDCHDFTGSVLPPVPSGEGGYHPNNRGRHVEHADEHRCLLSPVATHRQHSSTPRKLPHSLDIATSLTGGNTSSIVPNPNHSPTPLLGRQEISNHGITNLIRKGFLLLSVIGDITGPSGLPPEQAPSGQDPHPHPTGVTTQSSRALAVKIFGENSFHVEHNQKRPRPSGVSTTAIPHTREHPDQNPDRYPDLGLEFPQIH